MKLNLKVRMKNPWFWIGLGGIIFTAMGVSPEMLTSWDILWDNIVALVQNPFMLGSVAIAIVGVFIDPTTSGASDSSLAMTYKIPKKDK
jgi:phi LC3 family holin